MALELKILVTWGNGFIWKKLINRLKENNISFISFKWDLLKKEQIESYFTKYNIKEVIHLVGTFSWDFDQQMKLNFQTTKNILEIWKDFWLRKIIYTSTWAIYWEPKNNESVESDPSNPNTFYWLSKKLTEELIKYYSENFWIQSIILRFPNVYWEWNNKWVIYHFMRQINEDWIITLQGDGSQWRNFLHVDDAVTSIISSINYQKNNIFNISNPICITLNDLIELLKTKYSFEVKYIKSENNLQFLYLNIDKAKRELGFEPKFKNIKI